MSAKVLLYQLEINFWNAVIPLMLNSPPVRYMLPRVYVLARGMFSTKTILQALLCTAAGVSVGFVLGMLSQFR